MRHASGVLFTSLLLGATALVGAAEPEIPAAFADASAVVLLDDHEWGIRPGRDGTYEVRRKILVRDPSAFHLADQHIFYDGFEDELSLFSAATVQPDGTRVPVDESLIYESKVVRTGNRELILRQFTFPAVQVGSILDLHYALREGGTGIRDWAVQREFPVLRGRFFVTARQPATYLPVLIFAYARNPYEPHCARTKAVDKARYKTMELTCTDLPPIELEPSGPPEGAVRIEFMIAASNAPPGDRIWSSYGSFFAELLSMRSARAEEASRVAKALIEGIDDPSKRIEAIYHHVRDSIELRSSLGFPRAADEVLASGGGDGTEIGILFTAMLEAVGAEVGRYMVADRTRSGFEFDYPDPEQASHLLLKVHLDGASAIVDPACRACRLETPDWRYSFGGTAGIPLRAGLLSGGIEIGRVPPERNRMVRTETVKVSVDGTWTIEGKAEWSGQPEIEQRRRWWDLGRDEQRLDLLSDVHGSLSGLTFDGSDPRDLARPLSVSYGYTRVGLGKGPREQLLIRAPDVFSDRLGIPIQDERRSDIWHPFPFMLENEVLFKLPSGYDASALPDEKISLRGPNMSFRGEWSEGTWDNEIIWRARLRSDPVVTSVERYDEARRFALDVRQAIRDGITVPLKGHGE